MRTHDPSEECATYWIGDHWCSISPNYRPGYLQVHQFIGVISYAPLLTHHTRELTYSLVITFTFLCCTRGYYLSCISR